MNKIKELPGMFVLNKYFTDFELIGTGGFGEVYSATYKKSNKRVAIKILNCIDDSRWTEQRTRFINEINILKEIHSSNVVKILGWHYKGNEVFYVMELIKGQGLKTIIAKNKKIDPDTAIMYAKQICQGLIEIHAAKIVHRDLKPSNILIDEETNSLKLIDFGISIGESTQRVTRNYKAVGSVQYMAPELLRGIADPSPRSDIYAFGIILFEMLEGKVPFNNHDDINQIMMMHINNELPRMSDVNVIIPQALENIVIRCTAKSAEQRYTDCVELMHDLETCLDSKRVNEKRLELNPSKSKMKAKRIFNSKLFNIIFFTTGGFLVAFIVIFVVLFLKGIL
ncbi:serine/threonine-protein kinase [Metamycoplasma hominis]|uniref:serine/threonine-protein kinase n=1 Tax=Metamycoplasma hominis TaxID=2098 RepID=UPI003CF05B18